MDKPQRINVDGIGRLPVFSHASVVGDLIYSSGCIGLKPGSLEVVAGGTGPQTRQALENLQTILTHAGATFEDVLKVNIYLTDTKTFKEMNEVYKSFFPSDPPSRTTIGCASLDLGATVEIDCVAAKRTR